MNDENRTILNVNARVLLYMAYNVFILVFHHYIIQYHPNMLLYRICTAAANAVQTPQDTKRLPDL